jgi:tetratricopeptide (TPR) repeat protein
MSSSSEVRRIIDDGVAAWEREHFEVALSTFEEVLADHPYFADVHNKAGLCLAMMGRAEEALGHFDTALDINPAYAEAHLNRGIILNELGRHEEARVALAKAGEIDTEDSTVFPSELGNQLADAHAKLGDLYLQAGFPVAAAEHFAEALEVRPRFQDIRYRYAEALVRLGRLEEARAELDTVLEARPHMAEVRIRLGVVLQRLGDRDRAIQEWRRCAADDPEDMRPRAYLASVGAALEGEAGEEREGD